MLAASVLVVFLGLPVLIFFACAALLVVCLWRWPFLVLLVVWSGCFWLFAYGVGLSLFC
jgi:hypothetical protein